MGLFVGVFTVSPSTFVGRGKKKKRDRVGHSSWYHRHRLQRTPALLYRTPAINTALGFKQSHLRRAERIPRQYL